jgi:hypothetical protein
MDFDLGFRAQQWVRRSLFCPGKGSTISGGGHGVWGTACVCDSLVVFVGWQVAGLLSSNVCVVRNSVSLGFRLVRMGSYGCSPYRSMPRYLSLFIAVKPTRVDSRIGGGGVSCGLAGNHLLSLIWIFSTTISPDVTLLHFMLSSSIHVVYLTYVDWVHLMSIDFTLVCKVHVVPLRLCMICWLALVYWIHRFHLVSL